jgi:hypothetical protein
VLRDPSKATQQILLGLEPLDDSEHFNKHMAGYISWLRSLEDKCVAAGRCCGLCKTDQREYPNIPATPRRRMAAHIMENLASYRALNNKYKVL